MCQNRGVNCGSLAGRGVAAPERTMAKAENAGFPQGAAMSGLRERAKERGSIQKRWGKRSKAGRMTNICPLLSTFAWRDRNIQHAISDVLCRKHRESGEKSGNAHPHPGPLPQERVKLRAFRVEWESPFGLRSWIPRMFFTVHIRRPTSHASRWADPVWTGGFQGFFESKNNLVTVCNGFYRFA